MCVHGAGKRLSDSGMCLRWFGRAHAGFHSQGASTMTEQTVVSHSVPFSENGIAFIWRVQGMNGKDKRQALVFTYAQADNLRARWTRWGYVDITIKSEIIFESD